MGTSKTFLRKMDLPHEPKKPKPPPKRPRYKRFRISKPNKREMGTDLLLLLAETSRFQIEIGPFKTEQGEWLWSGRVRDTVHGGAQSIVEYTRRDVKTRIRRWITEVVRLNEYERQVKMEAGELEHRFYQFIRKRIDKRWGIVRKKSKWELEHEAALKEERGDD